MIIKNIILMIFTSLFSCFPQISQASLFGDSEILTGTKYTDPDLPILPDPSLLPDPSFSFMVPDIDVERWIEQQLALQKSDPAPAALPDLPDLPAEEKISNDHPNDLEDWLLEIWVNGVLDPIISQSDSSLSIGKSSDSNASKDPSLSGKKRKRDDQNCLIASALEEIKNNQPEADQPQHKQQRVQ